VLPQDFSCENKKNTVPPLVLSCANTGFILWQRDSYYATKGFMLCNHKIYPVPPQD
jgi:hypothetical protein